MIDLSIIEKSAKLSEIEFFKMQYKNYKLIYYDEAPYVIDGKVYNDNGNTWYLIGETLIENKPIRYNNYEILLSIIKLADLISSTFNIHDGSDDEYQLRYSNEIIEWCKIYGLPFYSGFFMKSYCKVREVPIGGFKAFSLLEFKREILMLFYKFNLWYGLEYNDIEKILKHDNYIKPQNKIYTENDLQKLKESIACFPIGSLELNYNTKNNNYEIVSYARSIIDVAYFQLAMLMANKSDEKIKYCSKCIDPFIYYDGHTKFCDSCKIDLNRNYVKEHRKREKSEILKLYNEGVSIDKLSNDYKKTVNQITKWIKEVNL